MVYIIIGAALLMTAFLTLTGYNYRNVRDEIIRLYSQSNNISHTIYSSKQLDGLPAPVQKYFRHVLKEGQRYISYVNLTHNGVFKTAETKNWIKIDGEEYFTTEKPGFLWHGKTDLFTVTDKYINGKGKIKVTLLSIYNTINAKGPHYNQGELLRWLGESVWFPTNLLPSDYLKWSAIDNESAKINFNYKSLSLSYIVRFNTLGEIISLETKRYMGDGQLESWIGKLSNYQLLNNILIPTSLEAIWNLKSGEFPYAKFNLTAIDYAKKTN